MKSNPSILFGINAMQELDHWFAKNGSRYSKIIALLDENTMEHCLPEFAGALENLTDFELLEIESGESSKSSEILFQLFSALQEMGADRSCLLINLGGGVICDLGGFLASTYMRGIHFLNIPTSLLAMTDAAHGGKTGVDHNGIKNLIGSFALPQRTLIWTDFLSTLPQKEYENGYAEMLKHGLISDRDLWNALSPTWVEKEEIAPFLQKSIQIKTEIVEADPHELNERKKLNFGHSTAHAIESYFLLKEQEVSHGWAVAAGMWVEAELSEMKCQLSATEKNEIASRLQALYSFELLKGIEAEELHSQLLNDKKNLNGELLFVLLSEIGNAVVNVPIDFHEFDRAWMKCFNNA
jgi:3-dehydroquinate synthase